MDYGGERKVLPKPTITDESDKEEELNGTKNPMPNKEILLAYFEEV